MKTLWFVVGVVVVLVVLGFILWSVGASRAFDAVIEEVDGAYRISSLTQEYPSRWNSTEAAWQLDDAAGMLGLHVVPRSERASERPGSTEWDTVKGDFSDYISSLRRSESDTLPVIPEEVSAFLGRHEVDLDEIERLLLGDEEIRFVSRLDDGMSAPLPNLRGQVSLTKVLVTRSMAAELQGDHEAAWRSLEAVWRLERSLSDQPVLICRLISIADLKMLAAGARRLQPPVPEWLSEVENIEPRATIGEGIRTEMHLNASLREKFSMDGLSDRSSSKAVDVFREPIMRRIVYWEASYALRDMAGLIEIGLKADPCAFDPESSRPEPLERPWWAGNAIATPNLASAFTRANQAALDIEGTIAVLDLKKHPGAFEERPSSVCSGESWKIETLEDGSRRLYFTGDIVAPKLQPSGSEVSTRHVLPPE